MTIFWMVIANNGDGSSSIKWVTDPVVLAKIEELANEGNEAFASGDGLDYRKLQWPDGASVTLQEWLVMNHISVTTMEDLEDYVY